MIDPTKKEWIDSASYESMLYKLRFDPLGSMFFTMDSDTWEYWEQQFNIKREATGDNGVSASKRVGW